MSDTKISALTALTGANVDAANDLLPIVDTSVTTTKKITIGELFSGQASTTAFSNATTLVLGTSGGAVSLLSALAVTGAPTGTILPPVYGRVVRTAGDITTTSTTLVDVTGATVTFTTKARPVLVGMQASIYNDTINAIVVLNIDIDGALQFGSGGLQIQQQAANKFMNGSFSMQSAALTAASHTIKAQWDVSGNTGTIAASSTYNNIFFAQEL